MSAVRAAAGAVPDLVSAPGRGRAVPRPSAASRSHTTGAEPTVPHPLNGARSTSNLPHPTKPVRDAEVRGRGAAEGAPGCRGRGADALHAAAADGTAVQRAASLVLRGGGAARRCTRVLTAARPKRPRARSPVGRHAVPNRAVGGQQGLAQQVRGGGRPGRLGAGQRRWGGTRERRAGDHLPLVRRGAATRPGRGGRSGPAPRPALPPAR